MLMWEVKVEGDPGNMGGKDMCDYYWNVLYAYIKFSKNKLKIEVICFLFYY